MIVSESARVLFVHVQKTGGTSVSNLLLESLPDARQVNWMRGSKHATLSTALRARPELSDYFTFGFVRNPWARLWSWHSMVMRRFETAPHSLARNTFWNDVVERHADFESFVMEGPDHFGRLRRPQLDYLRAGEREADFVGRTETLDADIARLRDRLGLPAGVAATRDNAGPRTSYREQYTDAMRDRVESLFAADIERFDYAF